MVASPVLCERCFGLGRIGCDACGEAPSRACAHCNGTGRAPCLCEAGSEHEVRWSPLLRAVAAAPDASLDELSLAIGAEAVTRVPPRLEALALRHDPAPLRSLLARRAHSPDPRGWRKDAAAIARAASTDRLLAVAQRLGDELATVLSIVDKPLIQDDPTKLRIALALIMGLHGARASVSLAWATIAPRPGGAFEIASMLITKVVDGDGAWRSSEVLFDRSDLVDAPRISAIGGDARRAGEDESLGRLVMRCGASGAAR